MPVAQKQETFLDETQYQDEFTSLRAPKWDLGLFKEIKHFIDQIKAFKAEEEEDRRKVNKIGKYLEAAEEVIAKGVQKVEAMKKHNETLTVTLENANIRTEKSLDYWRNYGLDVREIGTNHYEFIFTKLTKSSQGADGGMKCAVGIKYHDKKLEIVSQEPEILTAEQIVELNNRMSTNCVKDEGSVDYRSAMVMIKKELASGLPL